MKNLFSILKKFSSLFWITIIATFVNQLGMMVFPFFILYMSRHLHFSLTASSFIFIFVSTGLIISNFFSGIVMRYLKPIYICTYSLFINFIIMLLIVFIKNYFLLLSLTLILGFSSGFFRPASQALVSSLSDSNVKKLAFSVYRMASNLGMSVSPLIGGFVANISFSYIFIISSFTSLLAGLIYLLNIYINKDKLPDFQIKVKEKFNIFLGLRDKSLLFYLCGVLITVAIFAQHESSLSIYLTQDLNFSYHFYGSLFTINTLLIVFCEVFLNYLTLRWAIETNLIAGAVLIVIGFFCFYFVHSMAFVILLTIIWTFGEMSFFPAANVFATQEGGVVTQDVSISLFNVFSNLGFMLGPWLGILAMDYFQHRDVWLFCLIFGMIGVLFFYLSKIYRKKSHVMQNV